MDPANGRREHPGSHPDRAPLRIGVIGCGLIAQVMHLPYLRELSDRFSLEAICDLSPSVLVGRRRSVRRPETRHPLAGTARAAARCRADRDARIARPARDRGRAGRSSRLCREADVLLAGRRAGDDRGGAGRLVHAHGRQHEALRPRGRAPAAELAATTGPPSRPGHDARGAVPPVRPARAASSCRPTTSMSTVSRWPCARRTPRSPRRSPTAASRPGPSIRPCSWTRSSTS